MGLRQRGSVIGNYATASSNLATGVWTAKEAYTLQKKGTWKVAPSFTLTSSAATINEGSSVTFTLTTTGIPNGTLIPYTASGSNVNVLDFTSGNLTGNFVIVNGTGTASFSARNDVTTEGTETIEISALGLTANVIINDTSTEPDPQFPYTTLLLKGDGTNNSQNNTFLDSSTNNFTLTRNGNPTQGTFTPYGSNWSTFIGYGAYGYQSLPSNTGYDVTGADFTIEFWANFSTWNTMASSGMVVLGNFVSTNGWYLSWNGGVGANLSFSTYNAGAGVATIVSTGITAGTNFQLGTWNHFTVMQKTNVIYFYLNGVMTYSTAAPAAVGVGQTMYVGVYAQNFSYAGNPYFYYSNLRIIKGTGLYSTTGFTPPTTPLTAIAGTTLLIGKSSSLVDNSEIKATITNTVSGTAPSSQRFSPFSPSGVYSASEIGGSAYFDGAGDYLVTPTSSELVLGTNAANFTMECWVYNNGYDGSQYGRGIFLYYPSGAYGTDRLMFRLDYASNKFNLYLVVANSAQFGGGGSLTTRTAALNSWTHVALVRNAGVFYVYINGVLDLTVNSVLGASAIAFTTFNVVELGRVQDGTSPDFNGYISNYRFVKGTAVYTGNFTPPTSPLLTSGTSTIYSSNANVNVTFAAANTALLCNFTNAGIIDNAMMNNLETAADAKISTTQSKFGGTSMSFDGTGDYLAFSNRTNRSLYFYSSNWTVEMWIYYNTTGTYDHTLLGGGPALSFYDLTFGVFNYGTQLGFWNNGGFYGMYAASNLTSGVWRHITYVRNSDTITIYINGTSVATQAFSAATKDDAANDFLTGVVGPSFNGYIDDLRITKGYARYTSNFTPPTKTFQSQ